MFARLMGLKTISPEGLYQLVQNPGAVSVIDVNSRQSWATARVPGSRNLDPVDYKESDLPADKGGALVFYCSNPMCRKAPNAARRAKALGYEQRSGHVGGNQRLAGCEAAHGIRRVRRRRAGSPGATHPGRGRLRPCRLDSDRSPSHECSMSRIAMIGRSAVDGRGAAAVDEHLPTS